MQPVAPFVDDAKLGHQNPDLVSFFLQPLGQQADQVCRIGEFEKRVNLHRGKQNSQFLHGQVDEWCRHTIK